MGRGGGRSISLTLLSLLAVSLVLVGFFLTELIGPTLAGLVTGGIPLVLATISYVKGPSTERTLQARARKLLSAPRTLAICTALFWAAAVVAGTTWWLLQPETTYNLAVTVHDPDGRPVEGFSLALDAGAAKTLKTEANGQTTFAVKLSQLGGDEQLRWVARTGPGSIPVTEEIVRAAC